MAYVLAACCAVLGLILSRSHLVTLIILVYFWILFALNIDSPDSSNFEYMYYNINTAIYELYEPGFVWLCKISLFFDLTYQEFRMVVATIYIFFLILSIKDYTIDRNLVLVLFLIYPFLGYVSGLRSALGAVFAFYSFHYLLQDKKSNLIKYIFGILFATMFHYSSIAFLLLLFARTKVKVQTLLIINICLMFSLMIGLRFDLFLLLATKVINNAKPLTWLDYSAVDQPSLIVLMVPVILLMIQIYLFYRAKHLVFRSLSGVELSRNELYRKNQKSIFDNRFSWHVMERVNILLLLVIAGYNLNLTYARLTDVILPMQYSVYAYAISKPINHDCDGGFRIKKQFLYVLMFCLVLQMFWAVFFHGNFQIPILKDNLLFI